MRVNKKFVMVGSALAMSTALLVSGCSTSVTTGTEDVPEATFSSDEGSVSIGGDLPSYWPTAVPIPVGFDYLSGAQIDNAITATFAGSESADAALAQYEAALESAGYKQDSSFGEQGVGGLSIWTKGDSQVNVVSGWDGQRTTMNITITSAQSQ